MKSRTQIEIENLKQELRERERERRIVNWGVLVVNSLLTSADL